MKLLSFHLMPYTRLPEDFADHHDSIWVDLDSRLIDPLVLHKIYNEFMDELEQAAELGFDGICVNEHHQNGYGLMPSPNLIAAALARRTRDAAIVVLGNSIALYNPPIRVAEEFAMLDCISGGRLVAGFPVGTPMDTCYAYGRNPSQLRDRYYEAHDLILEAWQNPDPFPWNGRFNKLRYVNITTRPIQKPHPPIWIPGSGSLETWRWCAEQDYVYCYLSYYGYKLALDTMRGFWNAMEDLGREPNPFNAGFMQFVGVAESREEAFEIYRESAEYFFARCLHVDPRWASPPGYASEATQRARIVSQIGEAAKRAVTSGGAKGKASMEEIVERGYLLIGSPDEVAEQLRHAAEELRVGHMMVMLQYGNMDRQLASYNAELFAKGVMPQLKNLYENEWEDKWWPRPLPAEQRVQPADIPR